MLPGFFPAAGGTDIPRISFIGANFNTVDGSTFTFTNEPIGNPTADRLVVVCASSSDGANQSISGITIGGVAMNLVVAANLRLNFSAIYSLVVAAGTTATIVVSMTNGRNCTIETYALYGLSSTTAVATDSKVTTGASSLTATIATSAQGVLIGCYNHFNSTATTWSGANEDYDAVTESGNRSSASLDNLATSAGVNVQATGSVSNNAALLAASWR